MAEENEELEQAKKDTAREYKLAQSELSDMRRSFTEFSRTQRELNSAIGGLKSPIISSISNLYTNNVIAQEQITLKKAEIVLAQKALVAKRAEVNLASELATATQRKIDSLKESQQRQASIDERQSTISQLQAEASARRSALRDVTTLTSDGKQAAGLGDRPGAAKPLSVADRERITSQLAQLEEQLATEEVQLKYATSELAELREKTGVEQGKEITEIAKLEKELKKQQESTQKLVDEQDALASDYNQKQDEIKKMEFSKWAQKWSDVSKVLETVQTSMTELITNVRKTQQAFGVAAGQAVQLNIGAKFASMTTFFEDFGTAAFVSAEEIQGTRAAFQEQFGGTLTRQAAEDLAQQSKDLGVSAQQMAAARRVFMTSTMGDVVTARTQQDQFMAAFRKQGLTNKDAMNAIAQYSELYARNGSRFADSFAKAAIEAKKIGVDLGKIDQVGDNIIGDFEGFLEKTAELGAMGFGFDSSRLAEVAESGDTGALMTELRSQLAAQGKDLTNLRRSEQLALSNAFGIPMAELQRLAQKQTDGSGEALTGQEQTNSLLSKLVNLFEKAGLALGLMAAVISGVIAAMTTATALNTARMAVQGSLGGEGKIGFLKNLFMGGKGTPMAGGGIAEGATTVAQSAGSGIAEGAASAAGSAVTTGTESAISTAAGGIAEKAAPASGGMLSGLGTGLTGLAAGLKSVADPRALAGLAAVTLSIIGLGFALKLAAPGIEAIGVALKSAFEGIGTILISAGEAIKNMFIGLSELSIPQMIALAATLPILSASLGLFAITSLAASPGLFIFTNRITKLAESAPGIQLLANSFSQLNTAVLAFNNINTEKLAKVKEIASPSVGAGIANIAKSIDAMITSAATEGKVAAPVAPPVVDFSRLEAKLDQVVRAIGSMEVKLDATKVGEIIVANERRSASNGIFSLPRMFG